METSVSPAKKQSILKSLAIAGLLGITILIAWLAVQIVNIFPAALTSLVGVAQSVYNYNPLEIKPIAITKQSTLVNANESFVVSWDTPRIAGTYTFQYPCHDGVSISLTTQEKTFSNLNCATEYDLGTTDSVTLFVDTTRERFTNVNYQIAFYRPNSTTPTAETAAQVTIINTAILETASSTVAHSNVDTLPPATTEPATSTKPTETTPPAEPEPEPPVAPTETPTKPKPKPVAKPQPATPAYVYTYAIPTSNPNGSADLSVSIAGLGYLDANQNFIRTDKIMSGQAGAIQFIVHNLGDKTSSTWSYQANLPGHTVYESKSEAALRPNERAVITVSYRGVTGSYLENFFITVTADGTERTLNNNQVGATEIVHY